jgi:acyl CoA:acetate/3-ketoacid CoA transferase alpha subunit
MNVIRKTVRLVQALASIPNDASLMIGGFLALGTPPQLIE